MANPNIVNVSSILGKTKAMNLTTTENAVLAATSGTIVKINSLIVSNIDGTNSADVSVDFSPDGQDYYKLASTITVPADATLIVISKEAPIYLEEFQLIRAWASANGDLQAVCSYEIIS